MNRHLHIVCLDAPWPADYGGAIDMFYKIKALSKAGIRIHLHYFQYNDREITDDLSQLCESVEAYPRKTGREGLRGHQPYIVASRNNEALLDNLNRDDYPVLLEGIHCTGMVSQIRKGKKIMVRVHNLESAYYRNLAKAERSWLKKFYFRRESRLLEKYEKTLPQDVFYACINHDDLPHFGTALNSFHLPAFIPFQHIKSETGIGNFCLYHGNLSVPENEKAALWLLQHVFSKIRVPFVIAGKKPSKRLEKMAHLCQHTCLVADPKPQEMDDLVRKAHINILPAFSTTGVKLKLLHALYRGRHCVVNPEMTSGTGLEAACHTGKTADALASIVAQLHNQPFTEEEIRLRERVLEPVFNNDRNAALIIQYLY